jgi:hypothetical protein
MHNEKARSKIKCSNFVKSFTEAQNNYREHYLSDTLMALDK